MIHLEIKSGQPRRGLTALTAAAALSVLLALPGGYARAQTWSGNGGDDNWSTLDNWVGGVPPTNPVLPDPGTANVLFLASARLTPVVDVNWNIASVTFGDSDPDVPANAFTLNGPGVITLNNLSNLTSLTQTINAGLSIGAGGGLFLNNTGRLVLNGIVQMDGNSVTIDGGTETVITSGIGDVQTLGDLTVRSGVVTFEGVETDPDTGEVFGSLADFDEFTINGTVNVRNNSALFTNLAVIGNDADDVGTIILDDSNVADSFADTFWTTNGAELVVGGFGTGTLLVNAGALVESSHALIGAGEGSTGSATVSGVDAEWSVTGDHVVGFFGDGTLRVENGGYLETVSDEIDFFGGDAYLGYEEGSSGTATVTGVNTLGDMDPDNDITSYWGIEGTLFVGGDGAGSLSITNGGEVDAGNVVIGAGGTDPDAEAVVNVSGFHVASDIASSLTVQDTLTVGEARTGTLNISDEAGVFADFAVIGAGEGVSGTVNVDHAFLGSFFLAVGGSGSGTLNIDNGGQVVTIFESVIGADAGAVGTVNVDGISEDGFFSEWQTGFSLVVGGEGSGSLSITNGASVLSDGFAEIGTTEGGSGAVTVDGVDSNWGVAEDLDMGTTGSTASLTLTDGGRVDVYGRMTIGNSNATVVVNGGSLFVGSLTADAGQTPTIAISDPSLINGGGPALIVGGDNTDHTFAGNIVNAAGGPGSLLKIGTGILTLTGANTYTGATGVYKGTLALSASNASTDYGIAPDAILDLNALPGNLVLNGTMFNDGTVTGALVEIRAGGVAQGTGNYADGYMVAAGGEIHLGNSPGILSSTDAFWEGDGTLTFDIANVSGVPGVDWGLNNITGTLTINSTPTTPFTIAFASWDSILDGAGPAANWNPSLAYEWLFASASEDIVGFDLSVFVLDSSAFTAQNNTNGGTFGLRRQGNGLYVTFAPNQNAGTAPEPATLLLILPLFLLWAARAARRHHSV